MTRLDKKVLSIAVVVVVAFLYFSGRLDHMLYHVGLNYQTCGENGFGAVFCGGQLTSYQHRIDAAQQELRRLTNAP